MSDALTFNNEDPTPSVFLPFSQYNTVALASAPPSTLLHFDDGNNSTAFTDSGTNPSTWTATNTTGTAAESTAQAEFGVGALFFSGNKCWISTPQPASGPLDLTAVANFTVECWVYPTSTTQTNASGHGDCVICDLSAGQNTLFELQMLSNLKVTAQGFGGNGWSGIGPLSAAMNLNAWNHIAFVRNGNNIYLGVNGVLTSGSVTGNATAISGSNNAFIGADNLTSVQQTGWSGGYIDEFAVTLAAKYTGSSYTVPTAPFSIVTPPIPVAVIAGAMQNFLLATGVASGLALPSAYQLYQQLQGLAPSMKNFQFRVRIVNTGGVTLTLTAGAGMTTTGTLSIANNTWREFDVTIAGPQACNLKSVGSGTYS